MAWWLGGLGSGRAGVWKLTRPRASGPHATALSGYLRLSAASFTRLPTKSFRGHAEITAFSASPSPPAASHASRPMV